MYLRYQRRNRIFRAEFFTAFILFIILSVIINALTITVP